MTARQTVTWGGLVAVVGVLASFLSAWGGVGAAMDARLGHERELSSAVFATREQMGATTAQLSSLDTSLQSLTVEIERLRVEMQQLRSERRR